MSPRGPSPAPRPDSTRTDERSLSSHNAQRLALRSSISLSSTKAAALLASPAGSSTRQLKADKFTLLVAVRGMRLESARLGVLVKEEREVLEIRRDKLTRRRQLLERARRDLEAQTTELRSAGEAEGTSLKSKLSELERTTNQLRNQRCRTLLTVYRLEPIPPPPLSQSSPFLSSLPAGPTFYTIATLPLPSLPPQPSPTLSASLSHLVHLTRLLALYMDVALPFSPLPSLYGPGRPGVRSTPLITGGHVFPLFTARSSNNGTGKGKGKAVPDPGRTGEQSGGLELDKESERVRLARSKALLGGLCALTLDLAYLAWIMGDEVVWPSLNKVGSGRTEEEGHLKELMLEMGNLGETIRRAACIGYVQTPDRSCGTDEMSSG